MCEHCDAWDHSMDWNGNYELNQFSKRMQLKKERLIRKRGPYCEHCRREVFLQMHHIHYENLLHEPDGDFKLLCTPCHELADQARDGHRKATRNFAARLNGFAKPRWGLNWRKDPGYKYVKIRYLILYPMESNGAYPVHRIDYQGIPEIGE